MNSDSPAVTVTFLLALLSWICVLQFGEVKAVASLVEIESNCMNASFIGGLYCFGFTEEYASSSDPCNVNPSTTNAHCTSFGTIRRLSKCTYGIQLAFKVQRYSGWIGIEFVPEDGEAPQVQVICLSDASPPVQMKSALTGQYYVQSPVTFLGKGISIGTKLDPVRVEAGWLKCEFIMDGNIDDRGSSGTYCNYYFYGKKWRIVQRGNTASGKINPPSDNFTMKLIQSGIITSGVNDRPISTPNYFVSSGRPQDVFKSAGVSWRMQMGRQGLVGTFIIAGLWGGGGGVC